ncbi:uncharacterized protein LAESUDRAFT_722722 [Laetiporus sulphureus 93-53]|uniref:RING-type domain-containing protein n=1 Tax=Laetiporus sulphureus 93-53 TaxID=1314785 RepID=A0A165G2G1_9APHY|nr:uncharacterized protein LAESUDRAFT_722722 [Laetiporus sulphureus 93-53]KZT09740.1 hypothetical protein LAESUDRAFT_722722 [Laetiporus sulphureus 93-53]
MNARCSICLDTLTEKSSPMTTVCGHLYCLDCATFNFASDNSTCAICRRPHTLPALIKLYPDYERSKLNRAGPSSGTRSKAHIASAGAGVLDACYDVIKSEKDACDPEALETALSKYVLHNCHSLY